MRFLCAAPRPRTRRSRLRAWLLQGVFRVPIPIPLDKIANRRRRIHDPAYAKPARAEFGSPFEKSRDVPAIKARTVCQMWWELVIRVSGEIRRIVHRSSELW